MAETIVSSTTSGVMHNVTGIWGPYWADASNGVMVLVDDGSDLSTAYTSNGGTSWAITEVEAGTVVHVAAWYDKETPSDTGTNVHIAWMDQAQNDVYYIPVDASDGTQGTKRTVDSTLTANATGENNRMAITKTKGGNLIVAFSTQNEIECYKSSNQFATAGTDIADVFELGSQEDWVNLYPASTADNNDAAAIFLDRSADEISIKMYDDSANSWTETSISGSIIDEKIYKGFDAAVRHSDGNILLVAHSDQDAAGDDLQTWDLTPDSIASPTVTAKTNIFTNQASSAQAALSINQQNDDVYVAYLKGGTWRATVDAVYHISTDGMGTWGSEQAYSEAAADDITIIAGPRSVGDDGGNIQWSFSNDDITEVHVNLVNDVEIPASAVAFTPRVMFF